MTRRSFAPTSSRAAPLSAISRSTASGEATPAGWVRELVRARSDVPSESRRYGLGFWLHATTDAVMLVGSDAGVSFHTVHEPRSAVTRTVISNTTDGAWPLARYLMST